MNLTDILGELLKQGIAGMQSGENSAEVKFTLSKCTALSPKPQKGLSVIIKTAAHLIIANVTLKICTHSNTEHTT